MSGKSIRIKRTTIVLPAKVYKLLAQRADMEDRATANLEAFVVEQDIKACYPEEFPNPYQKRICNKQPT